LLQNSRGLKIKFLVIRFSSIGDIVLTSPIVRCLKKQVEGAEVHFATKKKFASIASSNPYIDKVHSLSDKLTSLLENLEKEQFDYIIDLHQNFRSNRIKSRLKIPAFSFEKLNLHKFLLVNFKINKLPDLHIVDRYMKTLSVFDVKNDGQGLDFFIPDNKGYSTRLLPEEFRNGFIAFVIAGTYYTKRLPIEKVTEICEKVEAPVVLLGGKREINEGEKIASGSPGKVLNLCGKTSLAESADLLIKSNIVLTNDTGLMHIAAAFKKKILSFWGNTVPEFGMVPYLPHPVSKIMEIKNLKCRPCSKLGYEKCPKKHFRCMRDINTTDVAGWVNKNY